MQPAVPPPITIVEKSEMLSTHNSRDIDVEEDEASADEQSALSEIKNDNRDAATTREPSWPLSFFLPCLWCACANKVLEKARLQFGENKLIFASIFIARLRKRQREKE